MKAEIIAVGTEILLGNIVNTNAQIISQGLSELGIDVYYQTEVGDNPERLKAALQIAAERADILLTTGGLGPTLDDLTKETLAEVFKRPLELHQPSLDRLHAFFKKQGREMTDNNLKQAWLPIGCTVLTNKWGTAPGCAFEAEGKYIIMLPGPPRECEPMFRELVMPYLYPLAGGCIVSHIVRVFGIGESNMEAILHDMMESMKNPTIAPYAGTGECYVRITAKADTKEAAENMLVPVVKEVCRRLGDSVYGIDVDSLEQVVVEELKKRGMTLAVAESCTGGLLSKRLTDLPGVSACYKGGVCSYCNEVKEKILGVSHIDLEEYGAVSETVACQMAEGVAHQLEADIGVGITGIAGPDGGSEEKPVGLVYIAVTGGGKTYVLKAMGALGRDRIRIKAASMALSMIQRYLLK